MSWGMAPTLAYPSSVIATMDGLEASAAIGNDVLIRPGPPPGFAFGSKLITVQRTGGGPDEDDTTDYPVMRVACYAPTYEAAVELQAFCEVEILGWPGKFIGSNEILVDEAEIYIGEQEIPDIYPDERRVVSTYRLGWRRQIRP